MMRSLRRLARHVALPLVLLLPGLGGTWLQEAHPCPTRHAGGGAHAGHAAPAVPAAAHDAHHAHHGAADPAPAQAPAHDEGAPCTCVGACGQGAAPVVPPGPALLEVAERALVPVEPTVPEWLPVFTPTDFLPLSTAPPRA